MTISPLLRALAAAASLLLSAPAWSAGEEPPPPPAASQSAVAAVAETRTLIEQGRFEEALGILRPLAQGGAVEANVLFLIGLAATGASQQPDFPAMSGRRCWTRPSPRCAPCWSTAPIWCACAWSWPGPSSSRGRTTCRASISSMSWREARPGQWPPTCAAFSRRSGRGGAGACVPVSRWRPTPTSGAPRRRESSISTTCRSRRDQAELTTSGIGVSVWGGWEYQYPLNERLRLRIGADASRREYAGRRFDQMFVSGHAGPRWLVGANTEASVLASAHRRWSANVPDYDALGGRIEAGHRFTRRVTASARASWHDRRYRTRMFLDGPAMAASLSGAWVVTPTVRADAALGWGREQPERERWRNDSQWLRLGASVILPRGFTVGGSGELRRTEYEGRWFPFTTSGEPREDRTRSLRVSCTTGPSRGRASARNSRWCTRCGRPMHSSTTTSAPAANCASCAFSDATGRSRASIFLVVMLATAPDCMRMR